MKKNRKGCTFTLNTFNALNDGLTMLSVAVKDYPITLNVTLNKTLNAGI